MTITVMYMILVFSFRRLAFLTIGHCHFLDFSTILAPCFAHLFSPHLLVPFTHRIVIACTVTHISVASLARIAF